MRRMSLAWVLSVLLVFAQHGAVLHELGHLSHGSGTSGAALLADLHGADSGTCPSCEGFAQVANPAAAAASTLPVRPARFLPVAHPCQAFLGAQAPTPRNRGPPQV